MRAVFLPRAAPIRRSPSRSNSRLGVGAERGLAKQIGGDRLVRRGIGGGEPREGDVERHRGLELTGFPRRRRGVFLGHLQYNRRRAEITPSALSDMPRGADGVDLMQRITKHRDGLKEILL